MAKSTAKKLKNNLPKNSQGQVIGIRGRYKPDEEQRKTLAYVYRDRYKAMQEAEERSDEAKKWDKWERQMEQYRPDRASVDDDSWQSNHVSPVTVSIVQSAISELIDQTIRPFYGPNGTEKQAKADLMQHIWDWGWRTANSDLMMYDVFWDALGDGTAITQEYYRQDRRIIRDVVLGKDNVFEEKETERMAYDDIYGEVVKLQDFFVDETARGFDGPHAARDCIRRFIMDIDDFYLMYKDTSWDQYDNAKLVQAGGDTAYYEYYEPPNTIDKTRQVEVLHYWSIKPKDRFVIVANDVVIRDGPNPYKHKELPFVRWVDVRRPHRFYGKGEPDLLESIQSETDTLRRMIIDRNHLDIDKMFMVSNRIGLTDEDLIARPHGMIPTDDVNGAKAIEYGDIPRSVELSLQSLEDDAVMVTGINPRQQALPEAATATAAALIKEGTLKRIKLKLWLMQKESFVRLSQLRTENFFQFYSQPRLQKIAGDAESQEYQAEVAQLEKEGLLQQDDDGNQYAELPRQIGLKNTKAGKDASGDLALSGMNGYSSYNLKAEDFLPLPRGGYAIYFDSGPNIQISKPLQQQANLELFDRFVPIAMQVPGSYDIVKLGDMVLKDADKNPMDLRPDAPGADQDAQMLQNSLQLAQMENSLMAQGKDVPATPYAQPAHTRIHLLFMNTPGIAKLPTENPIKQALAKHAMGEMMAQQEREKQGALAPAQESIGQPDPGQGAPPPQGQPQGAGAPPPQPSMSNGMQNKPGGMAPPGAGMTMTNMAPNQQNGSNPVT